jgi:hypothetical protein
MLGITTTDKELDEYLLIADADGLSLLYQASCRQTNREALY